MYFILNFLRAWAADALIRLGYAIAPNYYLEGMFKHNEEE
jgi:hypothetical protein